MPLLDFSPLSEPALDMVGVRKSFARGLARAVGRTFALLDIDLRLSYGEVLCVAGAESCGKTALLQCASGLMRCDAGTVSWFGEKITAGVPLRDVVYVPAVPVYYPFLTVRDVIEMSSARSGVAPLPLSWSSRETLALLQLDHRIDARIDQLTREEIRSLSVAEAIVKNPLVLVIDTAPLETRTMARAAVTAIRSFAEKGGAAMIAVRDAIGIAEAATRIVVLHEGRVRRCFYWDAVPPPSRVMHGALVLAETLH